MGIIEMVVVMGEFDCHLQVVAICHRGQGQQAHD